MIEVEVGSSIPTEPLVPIGKKFADEAKEMNKVIEVRKRLLHVKRWTGEPEVGIDLLVDTGGAGNIMHVHLWKKSCIPVEKREQVLVGFSGDICKTIVITEVVTKLG